MIALCPAPLRTGVLVLDDLTTSNDHRVHTLKQKWVCLCTGQAFRRRDGAVSTLWRVAHIGTASLANSESPISFVARPSGWSFPCHALLFFGLGYVRIRLSSPEQTKPRLEA